MLPGVTTAVAPMEFQTVPARATKKKATSRSVVDVVIFVSFEWGAVLVLVVVVDYY